MKSLYIRDSSSWLNSTDTLDGIPSTGSNPTSLSSYLNKRKKKKKSPYIRELHLEKKKKKHNHHHHYLCSAVIIV